MRKSIWILADFWDNISHHFYFWCRKLFVLKNNRLQMNHDFQKRTWTKLITFYFGFEINQLKWNRMNRTHGVYRFVEMSFVFDFIMQHLCGALRTQKNECKRRVEKANDFNWVKHLAKTTCLDAKWKKWFVGKNQSLQNIIMKAF